MVSTLAPLNRVPCVVNPIFSSLYFSGRPKSNNTLFVLIIVLDDSEAKCVQLQKENEKHRIDLEMKDALITESKQYFFVEYFLVH